MLPKISKPNRVIAQTLDFSKCSSSSTQQRKVKTVKMITNEKDFCLLLPLCIKTYLLTFSLCLLVALMFFGSVDVIVPSSVSKRGLLISL